MSFALTPAVTAAAHAHALAAFPREACGVVVEDAYVPMENTADDPEMDFRIARTAYAAVAQKTQAILHSHPNGDPWPTQRDMQSQIATAKPWGVFSTNGETCSDVRLWGAGVAIPPLVGRDFVHGVTDCYSLVRDYFRLERGIALPDVPRDAEWWLAGGNLYVEHFEAEGFRAIAPAEARPGDGFLCAIRSPVPNHAGILIESDLVLHHLQGRLSRREPLGPWRRHIQLWVRHDG